MSAYTLQQLLTEFHEIIHVELNDLWRLLFGASDWICRFSRPFDLVTKTRRLDCVGVEQVEISVKG
jgi:hypothetical protein